jgi:hypothetical protein
LIDFEKLLTLLANNGVQFVIVGGLAITIHGSSYVTFDLDICYARDDDNLTRLVQALKAINPPIGSCRIEFVEQQHIELYLLVRVSDKLCKSIF